jgi:TfoX/Sxy family transcriptional regulator of competence genes
MAYDEGLAARVRDVLGDHPDVIEKKMFGGLAFMVWGNMACGIIQDDLMVRVGPDGYEAALTQPHARVMDFTGKPMRGMVVVDGAGLDADETLDEWVQRGLQYALSLPPK